MLIQSVNGIHDILVALNKLDLGDGSTEASVLAVEHFAQAYSDLVCGSHVDSSIFSAFFKLGTFIKVVLSINGDESNAVIATAPTTAAIRAIGHHYTRHWIPPLPPSLDTPCKPGI